MIHKTHPAYLLYFDDTKIMFQVVDETLLYNDLATTLVLSGLAVYSHCNYYSSAIDLSPMENLGMQYLNIEDGIIYGIPSTFEVWLKDCRNYLEKVLMSSCFILFLQNICLSFEKCNVLLIQLVHFTFQCKQFKSQGVENFL